MLYVWAVVILLALVAEAATAQLVAVWFIPSAAVSLLLTLFSAKAWVQVLVFVVFSALLIIFARPILSKLLLRKPVEPTNADRLIGQIGRVVTDIDNLQESGEVKIFGEVWSARSTELAQIPKDTLVSVERIEGVKLICKIADINKGEK